MTAGNSLVYEGRTVPYDITYSPRRNSISIVVHSTKRVEIKAPADTPPSFIHDLAGKKAPWIVKQLRALDSITYLQVERQYQEGETFFFLGTPLRLSVAGGTPRGGILYDNGHLIVTVPGSLTGPGQTNYTRALVQDWYRDQADRIIGEKIREYATVLGVAPPPFRLKNIRRRWGSCSSRNNLNFNIRLIMAPIGVVEYVVMHELCHIRHKNHSRDFWQSLEEVMPDYPERRLLLRREGHRYVL